VRQEAGRLAHRTAEAEPDSEPVRGFLYVYELPCGAQCGHPGAAAALARPAVDCAALSLTRPLPGSLRVLLYCSQPPPAHPPALGGRGTYASRKRRPPARARAQTMSTCTSTSCAAACARATRRDQPLLRAGVPGAPVQLLLGPAALRRQGRAAAADVPARAGPGRGGAARVCRCALCS